MSDLQATARYACAPQSCCRAPTVCRTLCRVRSVPTSESYTTSHLAKDMVIFEQRLAETEYVSAFMKIFNQFDVDHDGMISESEYKQARAGGL